MLKPKCSVCEIELPDAIKGHFCLDCMKNLTYFERLTLMKLADISANISEISGEIMNR